MGEQAATHRSLHFVVFLFFVPLAAVDAPVAAERGESPVELCFAVFFFFPPRAGELLMFLCPAAEALPLAEYEGRSSVELNYSTNFYSSLRFSSSAAISA